MGSAALLAPANAARERPLRRTPDAPSRRASDGGLAGRARGAPGSCTAAKRRRTARGAWPARAWARSRPARPRRPTSSRRARRAAAPTGPAARAAAAPLMTRTGADFGGACLRLCLSWQASGLALQGGLAALLTHAASTQLAVRAARRDSLLLL